MRSLAALAAVAVMMPIAASAGSIMPVEAGHTSADSILSITCTSNCPPKVVKPKGPVLAPGSEIVSTRVVDGKTRIYRTENWLGGSPVTIVTTAPETAIANGTPETGPAGGASGAKDAAIEPVTPPATREKAEAAPAMTSPAPNGPADKAADAGMPRDGIDKSATTGSLSPASAPEAQAATASPEAAAAKPDFGSFTLRLSDTTADAGPAAGTGDTAPVTR